MRMNSKPLYIAKMRFCVLYSRVTQTNDMYLIASTQMERFAAAVLTYSRKRYHSCSLLGSRLSQEGTGGKYQTYCNRLIKNFQLFYV